MSQIYLKSYILYTELFFAFSNSLISRPMRPLSFPAASPDRFHFFLSSHLHSFSAAQLSSVAQSCPTLCSPMDCTTPGFPVHHQLTELAETPSIRVFSNESVLCIRWPEYWRSFNFSISPYSEYSGLISFRID